MNQNSRYEELDSIRGIAALLVMFSHMYEILPGSRLSKLLFEYGPLRLLISGGESVILFFVLSGFVLSLPFYKNKQSNYISFAVKRICRIYIPYIVAIIVAFGCKEMFYTGRIVGLTSWFNIFWTNPINSKVVTDHMLLVDSFLSNLNPVVWSLVHEMRISLVFPILMLLLVRIDWKKGVGLSILLSIISVVTFFAFNPADVTGTEFFATINYTAMFVIGALIAKYRLEIQKRFITLSKKFKVLLLLTGLLMYLYFHPSFAIKMLIFNNISPFYRTVIDSWAVTFGAVIIIVFAMYSATFTRILKNKGINFLGKISYSLYLVHLIVLFTCIHLLHSTLPIWIIYIICVIVTLVISSLMYFTIEKPSMNLGRFLTRSASKVEKGTITKHATGL
ncbi:acyltransferase [Paenibacillus sp. RC67]|uniref:acyltransferase family protein n=1 Tax=Paenibacillus sp. RC67 TaxID=3039392 RepID=UPI0024AD0FB0|nr:acyltransferase [Paenibacillus sp. RC67]